MLDDPRILTSSSARCARCSVLIVSAAELGEARRKLGHANGHARR